VLRPIDAYDARNLMYSGPPVDDCLEWIYDTIRKCASQGGTELVFSIPPRYPSCAVEGELRCRGFTVENKEFCSNRALGEIPHMKIKWG
jgi:hypothetical protein